MDGKTKNIAFQLVLNFAALLQNKRFCCPFNGSLTFYIGSTASCLDNQVAVVGGGVAGLSAASSLSEAGFDVVLLHGGR